VETTIDADPEHALIAGNIIDVGIDQLSLVASMMGFVTPVISCANT
jgi:hypothetical protein